MRPIISAVIPAILSSSAVLSGFLGAAEPAPLAVNDRETIVFYGDSITEQNLYTAFIENFLLTRFPTKDLTCHNYGWGGDTALGGGRRFARDVQPLRPSLVFVNFGMNDGGYRGPDDAIRTQYLANQRTLAEMIKSTGARQVLLTTSCIDPNKRGDGELYNTTLAAMADGVIALGSDLGVPVVDVFHPMRDRQQAAKKDNPNFCVIPDSVHPNTAGHLLLAWPVIRRLVPAKPLAQITFSGESQTIDGALVSGFKRENAGLSFTMTLNAIPMWVPPESREVLAWIPLERECNAVMLKVDGLEADQQYQLQIDGQAVEELSTKALASGVDLSLMTSTPWAQQAKRMWDLGQMRWQRHFDTWRHISLGDDEDVLAMSETTRLIEANRTLSRALAIRMHDLAKPKTHSVTLRRTVALPISSLEVSPVYPMSPDFAQAFAPESVSPVLWKKAPLAPDGMMDFNALLNNPTNCAVYVRVAVVASEAATLHLAIGSDDGLIVLLDGKRVFTHEAWRGVVPGQEQLDLPLTAGRHLVMLRINNGGGGYGLSLKASIVGTAKVTVLK